MRNLEPAIIHECLLTIKEIIVYSNEEFISYVCADMDIIRMLTRYMKSTIEAEYSPCLDAISQITSSETSSNIDVLLDNDLLSSFNSIMTTY